MAAAGSARVSDTTIPTTWSPATIGDPYDTRCTGVTRDSNPSLPARTSVHTTDIAVPRAKAATVPSGEAACVGAVDESSFMRRQTTVDADARGTRRMRRVLPFTDA